MRFYSWNLRVPANFSGKLPFLRTFWETVFLKLEECDSEIQKITRYHKQKYQVITLKLLRVNSKAYRANEFARNRRRSRPWSRPVAQDSAGMSSRTKPVRRARCEAENGTGGTQPIRTRRRALTRPTTAQDAGRDGLNCWKFRASRGGRLLNRSSEVCIFTFMYFPTIIYPSFSPLNWKIMWCELSFPQFMEYNNFKSSSKSREGIVFKFLPNKGIIYALMDWANLTERLMASVT